MINIYSKLEKPVINHYKIYINISSLIISKYANIIIQFKVLILSPQESYSVIIINENYKMIM